MEFDMHPKEVALIIVMLLSFCSPGHSQERSTPMKQDNEQPGESQEKLYSISVEGRWGFIDGNGSVVIEPQFLKYCRFSEGLASVTKPIKAADGSETEYVEHGFIDRSGKFVIGPGLPVGVDAWDLERPFYDYGDFHSGRATFSAADSSENRRYIDRTGKIVISLQYDKAKDFSDGYAFVGKRNTDENNDPVWRYGCIDTNGDTVLEHLRFTNDANDFKDGVCAVDLQSRTNSDADHAVIDKQGNFIVPTGKYSWIGSFYNGLARVSQDEKDGAINSKGELVIPTRFDKLTNFYDPDFALAWIGEECFIVNRLGDTVAKVDIEKDAIILRFEYGMALVEYEDKCGYVDTTGKLVIPYQFDHAGDFEGELANVMLGKTKGYINKQGEFVWKTDQWEEPSRNSVSKPLSTFVPENAMEVMPFSNNWVGVKNAIVFAYPDNVKSLRRWYKKRCDDSIKLNDNSTDKHGLELDLWKYGDFHIEVFAVDHKNEEADSFFHFYLCDNLDSLREKHPKSIIAIVLEN